MKNVIILICSITIFCIAAQSKDKALPREKDGQILGKQMINKDKFNYKLEKGENLYELKPPKVLRPLGKWKSLLSIYTHDDGQIYRIKWILPCSDDQWPNLKAQCRDYSRFKTQDHYSTGFGILEYYDERTKLTIVFMRNRVTFKIYDKDAIKKGKPDW